MDDVKKYDALKNAAQKATDGPWDAVADEDSAAGAIFVMPVCDQWVPPICRITSERDAIYVAEANPSAVLELIADFDAQRMRADTAEAERDVLKDDVMSLSSIVDECGKDLATAEQRIAELQKEHDEQKLLALIRLSDIKDCEKYGDKLFHLLRCCLPFVRDRCKETDFGDASARTTLQLVEDEFKRAALNPKPEAGSHEGN